MSTLHVYFAAPTADMALQAEVTSPLVGITTVKSKVADPFVTLGHLVALSTHVVWSSELIEAKVIYPDPTTKPSTVEAYALLQNDSPWRTGPWLHKLSTKTRDTLADLARINFAELSVRWGRIDQFQHIPEHEKGFLTQLIADLNKLALHAREKNHAIYCWTSL
jgi:hypothetical protein